MTIRPDDTASKGEGRGGRELCGGRPATEILGRAEKGSCQASERGKGGWVGNLGRLE